MEIPLHEFVLRVRAWSDRKRIKAKYAQDAWDDREQIRAKYAQEADRHDDPVHLGNGQLVEIPVLSPKAYLILQALLQLGAISSDKRQTTTETTKKAEGKSGDPSTYKKTVAALRDEGYLAIREGRGGGCWLTTSGKTIAEKL